MGGAGLRAPGVRHVFVEGSVLIRPAARSAFPLKARLGALPLHWRFTIAPALGLVLLALLTIAFVSALRSQGELVEHVVRDELGTFNDFAALSLDLAQAHASLRDPLGDARPALAQDKVQEAGARLEAIRVAAAKLRAALADHKARHPRASPETHPDAELLVALEEYIRAAKAAVESTATDARVVAHRRALANEAFLTLHRAWDTFLERERSELRAAIEAEARAARDDTLRYGAAGCAVALVLLVFAVIGARAFARSLERQLDALAALGREAGVATEPRGRGHAIDRIAAAIRTFRAAILQLRKREEEQHALNHALREARESLERRVEERTRELSSANEQLSRQVAERTYAQDALVRATRSYAALSETNKAILHVTERERLFRAVCRIAVEEGGIGAACVSFIDAENGRIRPYVRAGDDALQDVALLAGRPNAITSAVLAARPYIANDLAREATLEPLRGHAKRSAAWFPLFEGGRGVAVLTLLCRQAEFFDAQVIALLGEMVDNISFGLDNLARERERAATEQALRLRQRAIEASVNAITISSATRPGYPLEYVNPAYEAITGYSAADVLGRTSTILEGGDRGQPGIEHLRAAMRERREGRALLRSYRKDGRLVWNDVRVAPVRDDQGNVTHFVGVMNDVTETKTYQEQLEHQANHDALTGLPNRNLLRDRLEQALMYGQRQGHSVAVAMIDLDRFKTVNDSLGHQAGDELLATAARRIQSCLRVSDTLARLGGDEFVLVMPNLGEAAPAAAGGSDETWIAEALRRIQLTLAEPLVVAGRRFHVTCSIGVSRYPQDAHTIDMLLQQADAAMYEAKAQGRARFHFYSGDLNERISRRVDLEAGMRRALERGEFALHYQPKLDLESGRITGAEALLRWTCPERGPISPAEFIPLAEETGLIVPIGDWVLRAACRQIAAWSGSGLEGLPVAVNLSPRQLRSADLPERVEALLAQHGVAPEWLELEITETAMAEDPERMAERLRKLTERGVRLAIDDFGTGYSSLAYLKRFRASTLKIDRAFICDIAVDADDAAVTSAIVAMAKDLGMRTVGEGVETVAQLQRLRALGCNEIQGFLVSAALPPEDFAQFVSDRERLARARGAGESALPAVALKDVSLTPEERRTLRRVS